MENKLLVVGVIALFIGVAVQSGTATVQKEEEINVEPKDFLFQTIIGILNNPEVKDLLKQVENNGGFVDCGCDLRSMNHKLLFRDLGLFRLLILSRSGTTNEYLDFAYKKGIEISKTIEEDEAIEMVESIKISNHEIFDELNNIIITNEELSNRIAKLSEMNEELKSILSSSDYPWIICFTLFFGVITFYILLIFFAKLYRLFQENSTMYNIFYNKTFAVFTSKEHSYAL